MKLLAFPLKAEPTYSEAELSEFGIKIGQALKPGDRILLEGPMGAGKSTLARSILEGLGIDQKWEGSPTFPLAHEYRNLKREKILHVDFYRLKSEAEIEATGLTEAFWDRDLIILSEWTSQFEDFFKSLKNAKDLRTLEVQLSFENETMRRLVLKGNR